MPELSSLIFLDVHSLLFLDKGQERIKKRDLKAEKRRRTKKKKVKEWMPGNWRAGKAVWLWGGQGREVSGRGREFPSFCHTIGLLSRDG